jgi:hypothetical protein
MYYNPERLHSAMGYVTPKDKLEGREHVILAERKCKLVGARKRRSLANSQAATGASPQSAQVRLRVPEPCPL